MDSIIGEKIFLRTLDKSDFEVVFRIENTQEFWEVSGTTQPFSPEAIRDYMANIHLDIREVKQLRLAVCEVQSERILGLVDLFNFDAINLRAGVGILIESHRDRGKGYAAEAISLLKTYCKEQLGLYQLYANIFEDNVPSLSLFKKQGFEKIGVKRDWRRVGDTYKNEVLYQHIL